jgi:hypothetical protein
MGALRVLALAICATVVFTGCGNGLADVSGAVTLDGQPVSGAGTYGTVTFSPESGGALGVGTIDQSGRYKIETGSRNGIAPGAYKVAVSIKKVEPPVNRDAMPKATPISPEKYASAAQSGLRADVKPGRNSIDFALSSKGP